MTGQEHYEAAEARLGEVALALAENDQATVDRLLREAQVHATLAVAAATAWPVQRRCRVCGCTDTDCTQCIERTGYPCAWVEPAAIINNLCTACVP